MRREGIPSLRATVFETPDAERGLAQSDAKLFRLVPLPNCGACER
jgi:hypothetical protein